MRTDRELLERAAKAAAIETVYWNDGREPYSSGLGFILPSNRLWNPLDDDGDALRLAVKLHLMVDIRDDGAHTSVLGDYGLNTDELHGDNSGAATRRAIVRAAAEIGAQAHPDHKDGGAVYG